MQNAKSSTGTWRRAGLAGSALVAVAVAGIGMLHTSLGRPLLMRVGGCPLAAADPRAVQNGAQASVATERGTAPAPMRPALGFALDHTRLADLETWADEHGLACATAREETLYQCKLVPVAALPNAGGMVGRVDDLTFAFRADGTLWTLSAWSFALPAEAATARVRGVEALLEHQIGKAATTFGAVDSLGTAPGATSGAKYRYQDYVANLTATTVGSGVMVQQQYSSLRTTAN